MDESISNNSETTNSNNNNVDEDGHCRLSALQEPLLKSDTDNNDDDHSNSNLNNDSGGGAGTTTTSINQQLQPSSVTTNESAEAVATTIHSHHDRHHHLSRNIYITLAFQCTRCAGEAIWYYSVLSAYIYLLRPDNPAMVGYLSAIEGIAQFIAAAIAGIIADLYRRDRLLQLSSFIGLAASVMTFLSSYHQASTEFWWISLVVIAPILWGTFDGIGLTASLALFADSIPDGQRSYWFTMRTVSTTGGQVLGPVGALIMFAVLGDQWTIADCSKVICLAQFLLIPAFGLLWCFSDDDKPTTTQTTSNENDITSEENEERSNLLEEGDTSTWLQLAENTDAINEAESEEEEEEEGSTSSTDYYFAGMTKDRFIAIFVAASDVMCAFSQGISNRYFAIFLLNNLQLHPVLVQVLDGSACITGAALLLIAQRLAETFGRCPVSIALKLIGVLILMLMILLQHQWRPFVMACYVLQGSFLCSTQALTRSIIMDHVPSQERAKWSALESINIFGWCGSAAVGGLLVHLFHGDVVPVFWFTAVFQVVGVLPLVPLVKVVVEKQDPPD